ncbi:MAG: FkbM family methyltransferase, partial [Patescibacteria group bacterium]|nr:FkbM family methyltransferase [Patescibacteria group bacterium]
MMKKIIKSILPEWIKRSLRTVEDMLLRTKFAFTRKIILEDINGISFILDPHNRTPIRWQIERGAYSKEFSAMKKLVRPGDIAFDVGANTGTISSFLAKLVTSSGKIYAFEPFPETYRKLRLAISLNNINWIETYQLALTDRTGNSEFYFEPSNLELNSLGQVSNGKKKLSHKITVQADTIDDFCHKNSIGQIDFLKIDVEGFEAN